MKIQPGDRVRLSPLGRERLDYLIDNVSLGTIGSPLTCGELTNCRACFYVSWDRNSRDSQTPFYHGFLEVVHEGR